MDGFAKVDTNKHMVEVKVGHTYTHLEEEIIFL